MSDCGCSCHLREAPKLLQPTSHDNWFAAQVKAQASMALKQAEIEQKVLAGVSASRETTERNRIAEALLVEIARQYSNSGAVAAVRMAFTLADEFLKQAKEGDRP